MKISFIALGNAHQNGGGKIYSKSLAFTRWNRLDISLLLFDLKDILYRVKKSFRAWMFASFFKLSRQLKIKYKKGRTWIKNSRLVAAFEFEWEQEFELKITLHRGFWKMLHLAGRRPGAVS